MNDYGYKPRTLIGLVQEEGYFPEDTDVYSAKEPNWGNSNYGKAEKFDTLFWDTPLVSFFDTRLFYVFRNAENWSRCRWEPNDESIPEFWRKSKVTDGTQICYTTEALHYAQGAYFIAVVASQFGNGLLCKTRTLSFSQHQITNQMANISYLFEFALAVFLSYITALQIGLGTRAVASPHFAVPCFTYFAIEFLYDEVRKIYVRRGIKKVGNQIKYEGWVARNTLW